MNLSVNDNLGPPRHPDPGSAAAPTTSASFEEHLQTTDTTQAGTIGAPKPIQSRRSAGSDKTSDHAGQATGQDDSEVHDAAADPTESKKPGAADTNGVATEKSEPEHEEPADGGQETERQVVAAAVTVSLTPEADQPADSRAQPEPHAETSDDVGQVTAATNDGPMATLPPESPVDGVTDETATNPAPPARGAEGHAGQEQSAMPVPAPDGVAGDVMSTSRKGHKPGSSSKVTVASTPANMPHQGAGIADAIAPAPDPSAGPTATPVATQSEQAIDKPARGAEPDGATRSRTADSPAAASDRLAERLLLHRTQKQGVTGGREITGTDRARLVQRVVRAMRLAPRQGGTLRLRLRPPELGSLRLEVTLDHGTLSARIETENHTARSLLLDSLPQLRNRLGEQGFRIGKFDVDVSSDSSGRSPYQPRDDGEQLGTPASARTGVSERERTSTDGKPIVRRADSATDRLNVVI